MRYQTYCALVATGFFAMAAASNPVLAVPPDGGASITLAQAQQPATSAPTTPAPAAGTQQQPSGMSPNMPGQMKEHGQGMGMGEMGKGMGPTTGGQGQGMPGMGCPAGQTTSGTPSTCK